MDLFMNHEHTRKISHHKGGFEMTLLNSFLILQYIASSLHFDQMGEILKVMISFNYTDLNISFISKSRYLKFDDRATRSALIPGGEFEMFDVRPLT